MLFFVLKTRFQSFSHQSDDVSSFFNIFFFTENCKKQIWNFNRCLRSIRCVFFAYFDWPCLLRLLHFYFGIPPFELSKKFSFHLYFFSKKNSNPESSCNKKLIRQIPRRNSIYVWVCPQLFKSFVIFLQFSHSVLKEVHIEVVWLELQTEFKCQQPEWACFHMHVICLELIKLIHFPTVSRKLHNFIFLDLLFCLFLNETEVPPRLITSCSHSAQTHQFHRQPVLTVFVYCWVFFFFFWLFFKVVIVEQKILWLFLFSYFGSPCWLNHNVVHSNWIEISAKEQLFADWSECVGDFLTHAISFQLRFFYSASVRPINQFSEFSQIIHGKRNVVRKKEGLKEDAVIKQEQLQDSIVKTNFLLANHEWRLSGDQVVFFVVVGRNQQAFLDVEDIHRQPDLEFVLEGDCFNDDSFRWCFNFWQNLFSIPQTQKSWSGNNEF